jgi:transposase
MWTDDAREKYRMIARGYPSSMSDAEWALLEPHFPSPAATSVHGLLRGKDMLHPMRRIVDAIFYVLRNCVTWRALPVDFPPWQTVYYWFRRFARAALFERLNAALVALDRVQSGREAQPTRPPPSRSWRTDEGETGDGWSSAMKLAVAGMSFIAISRDWGTAARSSRRRASLLDEMLDVFRLRHSAELRSFPVRN